MKPIPDAVWSQISDIAEHLASGRVTDLARLGKTGRTQAADLTRVIGEYGRTLVSLPPEARDLAETYDRPAGELLLDVPLWTIEEGRSDLMLQVSCRRDWSGQWICVIEDLLVP